MNKSYTKRVWCLTKNNHKIYSNEKQNQDLGEKEIKTKI